MTETESRIVKITYNGLPRTFDSPAEDAEMVIWCEEAQSECDALADPNPVYDASGNAVYVTCRGDANHPAHELYATLHES
jgi:hypothetical protein